MLDACHAPLPIARGLSLGLGALGSAGLLPLAGQQLGELLGAHARVRLRHGCAVLRRKGLLACATPHALTRRIASTYLPPHMRGRRFPTTCAGEH